jgi:hypothetical protein
MERLKAKIISYKGRRRTQPRENLDSDFNNCPGIGQSDYAQVVKNRNYKIKNKMMEKDKMSRIRVIMSTNMRWRQGRSWTHYDSWYWKP